MELVIKELLDRLERGGQLPENRLSIADKISGFLDSVDKK